MTSNGAPVLATLVPNTPIFNGGGSGETSTQIKTRMLADTEKHGLKTAIWAGRNGVLTYGETIKADIAEMVAALTTADYVVLAIINGTNEGVGTPAYDSITGLNSYLEATYGANYWDVRAHLVTQGDGSAQDLQDVADDIVPSSLRIDTVHLTKAGYALVGAGIATRLNLT